jgi:hypothetical protein
VLIARFAKVQSSNKNIPRNSIMVIRIRRIAALHHHSARRIERARFLIQRLIILLSFLGYASCRFLAETHRAKLARN